MTNVDDAKRDAKFKAACEEYIREALADGLNREQVLARLEEMARIAFGESIADARSSFKVLPGGKPNEEH
ncbi:MAG: hypothetical protein WCD54_04270 [Pseudolabrys sp.]